MEYRTGAIGRVLAVRFDHDEDLLAGLEQIVRKENIRSGWFQIIGGLSRAGAVIGPREPVVPPDPVWRDMNEVREMLGSGSIHFDGEQPRIHLHAAMGHHGDTLTACVRRDAKVYLVLEVLLFEICGINAAKTWDEQLGFCRLGFSPS